MTDNPITRPMTAILDRSVKAASWLDGVDKYAAGVSLARLLAGQIDDVVGVGATADPELLKQLHMRMVPNFQRALFTLGLTPEGYAKMTGVGSPVGQTSAAEASGGPPGPTPFDAANAAKGDALDQLIAEETDRSNVIDMDGRR